MKHVSILVPEGTSSGAVTVTMDLLNGASNLKMKLEGKNQEPFFNTELISITNNLDVKCLGGYSIKCHKTYKEIIKTDLILIPNLTSDFQVGDEKIKQNQGFVDFILEQYAKGAEIAAFCTGTFLLAATGLLNSRKATTHWMAVEEFKNMFPKVKLEYDEIIIDEGRLLCGGGSTSSFNLVLYLVEKYCSHEIAVILSKCMLIDMDKTPQSTYSILRINTTHGNNDILKVQNFIEQNLKSKIEIDHLVKMTTLSKRSFNRKFFKSTGLPPSKYIQKVKIEWAKKKLELVDLDIGQIGYALSYNDPGAFRRIFKNHVGITPKSYREKFKSMIG